MKFSSFIVPSAIVVLAFIVATFAVASFLELSDTPSAYTGQAGNLVAVNVGETGLEFVVGNSFVEREAVWVYAGDVTAGAKPVRLYANRALILKDVRCSVNTAGTTSAIIMDVNKNGITIFTTQASRPSIAAAGFTDVSDAPDVTTAVSGDYFTMDVDAADSGNTGADLTCQLRFRHALDPTS